MGFWKQVSRGFATGLGGAVGVSLGRDAYRAAKQSLQEVDWEKVGEDAGKMVDGVKQAVGVGAPSSGSAGPSPVVDEARRRAEEEVDNADKRTEDVLEEARRIARERAARGGSGGAKRTL